MGNNKPLVEVIGMRRWAVSERRLIHPHPPLDPMFASGPAVARPSVDTHSKRGRRKRRRSILRLGHINKAQEKSFLWQILPGRDFL